MRDHKKKIPRSIAIAYIFVGLIVTQFASQSAVAIPRLYQMGKDHGALDPRHVQVAQEFYSEHLKSNGQYDAGKISAFIKHLEAERASIKGDVYETKLFEQLELDTKKFKKAHKNALEEADPDEGEIMWGIDHYLLPTMQKLLDLVSQNQSPELWDGITDDFARAYVTYFMPNGHRTFWPLDIDIPFIGAKMFIPYTLRDQDKDKPEAFNLQVSSETEKIVRSCLGPQVPVGAYLTPEDIERLQACGVDLSAIDPGVSALWKRPSRSEIKAVFKDEEGIFPKEGEKIIYKKVNIRSRTSPKIKAFVERDGKRVEFKIKVGQESHSEIAVGKITELLGFNQDQMIHRQKVRVYLDDTPYVEFIALLANKYMIESLAQFVSAHGEENGEEWIEFSDVLIEGRPSYEKRVAPFDIASWDLSNRREFRALLLMFGWLGINDMQPNNFKLVFQTYQDTIIPLLRIHDTGASLGGAFNLRKPSNFFGLSKYYRVNEFPSSFLKGDPEKGEVQIFWNDFANRYRNFATTTKADGKWMARQIAAIKPKHLLKVLEYSGMPQPVAKLYYYKLLMRRNELVRFFGLNSEFKPIEVPPLESLSLVDESGPVVKKGKVVRTSFPNQATPVQVAENWWTEIPGFLDMTIPVSSWNSQQQVSTKNATGLRGLQGLQQDLNLRDYNTANSFLTIPIGVGVQALVSRRVEANSHLMNADGQIRLYRITDSIALRIGATSPLLNKMMEVSPVLKARFSLQFYEKVFEHIHYEDTVKEAYLSNYELMKIVSNMNHYAAFHLGPLDVIHSFDRYGLDFAAGVGAYLVKPVVDNELSGLLGVHKDRSVYYVRDQYGHLHYYTDANSEAYAGINLALGNADLFVVSLPLLNLRLGASAFNMGLTDYVVRMPENDRDKVSEYWTEQRKLDEYLALQRLSGHSIDEDRMQDVAINYAVESKGKNSTVGLGALAVFNYDRLKSEARTKVTLANGDEKYFYRKSQTVNRYVGLERFNLDFDTLDLFIHSRKRSKVEVEMDEDAGSKFVLAIRTEDYYRVREVEKIYRLIEDLNRRYSQNMETPFYRGFELPAEAQVDHYIKVYALTHTFVFGKQLIESLAGCDLEALKILAKAHYTGSWRYLEGERAPKLNTLHKVALNKRVSKLIKLLTRLKFLAALPPERERHVELANLSVKVLKHLQTEVYGLYFLHELVKEDGLFVMGQISGILRSYSALNDLQQLQRRRFMGKSWGTYQKVPPLQRFMRRERLIPPSAFIVKSHTDAEIFGLLETGVPPNLESIYSHNNHF